MDCPDIESCRDPIYTRIREAEDSAKAEVKACAKEHKTDKKYRIATTISIVSALLIVGGGILTLHTRSIAQEEAEASMEKVETSIEAVKEENKDIREKQVNVVTRLESVEGKVDKLNTKVDNNRDLLIKIGAKLGVEEDER